MNVVRFHDGFFNEAQDHLDTLVRLALCIDRERPDEEDLAAIFRAAHSLKGGAATFGFRVLADATHSLESMLEALRSRELHYDEAVMQAILDVTDVLSSVVRSYRLGEEIDTEAVLGIDQLITRVFKKKPPEIFAGNSEAFGLFEDIEIVPERAPVVAPRVVSDASSIRVDLEKIDQLINVVGELVIAHAMLSEQSASLNEVADAPLLNAIGRIGRYTREIREYVMAVRMVPIGSVFSRYPRVVHDVASSLGKKAILETIGDDTELDKGITERLIDPLTHLVRNAVDHGLESPEERVTAGKSPEGRVSLEATSEGGNIVVRVRDDGRGLDRERIIARARERGITIPDDAPDAAVWELIFEAGFSTAQTVSDVSGRGVGMDVVRRNVAALQGSVEIDSVAGAGTTVTIRMPLTLAILDGLTVRTGSERYIIPMHSIIESIALDSVEHLELNQSEPIMFFRGEWLRVIDLGRLFSVPDRGSAEIAVVLESGTTRAALLVEELEAQHQAVIKSIERNFRPVPGLAGATVLGSGRVAPILDLATLLKMEVPS